MILLGALGGFCLSGTLAQAPQEVLPYWQDIQVVQVGKELPRSSFMTYPPSERTLRPLRAKPLLPTAEWHLAFSLRRSL